MSTRSGKRIHASVDSPNEDTEMILQSERKTRSKKLKENVDMSVKKRHNYVSYPADEDTASVTSDATDMQEKVRRTGRSQRNTLKDHNINESVSNNIGLIESNKSIKKSSRGKKLIEEIENVTDIENMQNGEQSKSSASQKNKKKKKKSHKKQSLESVDIQDAENQVITKKTIKKKKHSNSFNIKQHEMEQKESSLDNQINMSIDSFHSAAGSPINSHLVKDDNSEPTKDTIKDTAETSIAFNMRLIGDLKSKRKHGNKTDKIKAKSNEEYNNTDFDEATIDVSTIKSSIKNSVFDKTKIEDTVENTINASIEKIKEQPININTTLEAPRKKKKKSSIKNSIIGKVETKNVSNINTTFEKPDVCLTDFNNLVDLSIGKTRKSNSDYSFFDEIETKEANRFDITFEKADDITTATTAVINKRKSSINNSTFDKIEGNVVKTGNGDCFNETFDYTVMAGIVCEAMIKSDDKVAKVQQTQFKEKINNKNYVNNSPNTFSNTVNKIKSAKKGRDSSIGSTKDEKDFESIPGLNEANITFDKDDKSPLNSTFNKESPQTNDLACIIHNIKGSDETKSIGSVLEKGSNIELNTTFGMDKESENSDSSKKSSLISSDATVNVTFDKSGDISRVSITSDESKTENILNHTPVLIESSIDESGRSEDKTPEKSIAPFTPLKRESTFTKDGSDTVVSPETQSEGRTPIKRKSSPGSTPYPSSMNSQKRSVMNLTRSIEKSTTVNPAPSQTRVMFCSPANNPTVVTKVQRRVIKSSLKGSSKSFVFDDSEVADMRCADSSAARGVRRKRSLTLGEADARSKRTRLADDLQLSVDRLSRPRTVSATAKLPDPSTASKQAGTPSKARPDRKVARTKLPNFAALHQKHFAKMESLDECQERKAQRAKQLLTPTGCVSVLERISPKGTLPNPAPPAKESTVKLHTPSKPKLSTLESLNPGYTRFGFKLKTDVNPFSASSKPEGRKEMPNGASGQASWAARPSRAGATGNRRDVAKQTVMREKSFTEKRDVKRQETRTVIKGVRTNRRFDLQMKLRNIN